MKKLTIVMLATAMLSSIAVLVACTLSQDASTDQTTINVGCKLVTGGDNGKVVIPAGVTLVTGGEDCQ